MDVLVLPETLESPDQSTVIGKLPPVVVAVQATTFPEMFGVQETASWVVACAKLAETKAMTPAAARTPTTFQFILFMIDCFIISDLLNIPIMPYNTR